METKSEGKTLLDIGIVPFEPITTGSGQKLGEKQAKLAAALRERITPDKLAQLKEGRGERLVTLTVLFYLWKGSSDVTNTRPVKDLDNLLKVLFDVLRLGPRGLGVIEEDSYIAEVYACKQLVEDKDEEGYRIIMEEYQDEVMLNTLKEFYSKSKTET